MSSLREGGISLVGKLLQLKFTGMGFSWDIFGQSRIRGSLERSATVVWRIEFIPGTSCGAARALILSPIYLGRGNKQMRRLPRLRGTSGRLGLPELISLLHVRATFQSCVCVPDSVRLD